MPSSPSPLSPHGAPHPHEGDITPHAPAPECPICLEGPSSPPNELDAFFPCCAAFAHLGCIQQCAHRHGQCPNCRHSIAYLRHDQAFLARCEDAGVRMPLLAADGAETVYAAVSDYAVRTFSRADAPEPEEPHHVRASCCARLAGPAMGFVELPDRSMRWSPVPLRGHAGIRSWTPAWICMRCQAELPAASVSMPLPRPPCHCCHALMIWEVDLRLETERWVCNRCPASGPARPLDLRPFLAASPVQSPTADPVSVAPAAPVVPATPSPPALAEAGAVTPPDLPAAFALVSDVPDGHNPGPAFMDHTRAGPPHVPLHQATYSCVYVPLLLDAAGMLHAEARAQWRAHPAFAPWWHGAVTALLARPFLSVRDVRAAVGHVLPRFDGFAVGRLPRFFDWSSGPAPEVTSLAALVRGVGRPQEGYYLPGPLQEVLLVLLLGEAEAAALQRLLDGLRAPESAAARPVADSEPGPDAPECSSPVDGACDPDRLGVAQATAAATATDSPTLREASPPDALDATTASRRTQRLDHAAAAGSLRRPCGR